MFRPGLPYSKPYPKFWFMDRNQQRPRARSSDNASPSAKSMPNILNRLMGVRLGWDRKNVEHLIKVINMSQKYIKRALEYHLKHDSTLIWYLNSKLIVFWFNHSFWILSINTHFKNPLYKAKKEVKSISSDFFGSQYLYFSTKGRFQ